MENGRLLKKIEQLRQELHELTKEKGSFKNDEVYKKSTELDKLLNEYLKQIEESKEEK